MQMAKKLKFRRTLATKLLLGLLLPVVAWAETATLQIDFLPLDEAAHAVRSQLSPAGSVTTLPSRRLLIINDSASHIEKARALLKQLDQPLQQYRVDVEISEVSDSQWLEVGINELHLPGGWVQSRVNLGAEHQNNRKHFSLLTTANEPGEVEAGTLQPFLQQTRQWLADYGVITIQSVELVPVTSGFHVTVSSAGKNMARIRINPWARRTDAGNTIALAGAATEITIPLDKEITLAAHQGEAKNYGILLLSGYRGKSSQMLLIKLTCRKY